MKAKELAYKLLQYPDYEVEIEIDTNAIIDSYPYWVTYKINGIDDITYYGKTITFGVEEAEDE
jgi:hypothetical protein